jgi:hypothetical protein
MSDTPQSDSGNSVARNQPSPPPPDLHHGDPAKPAVVVQQTTPSKIANAQTGAAVQRVLDADQRNRSS